MEEKNPIQVADRLFLTLELLAEQGEMGLLDISGRLGLNKSTAHRILSSLTYLGYARQNPENGKYELTMKLVELSGQIMKKLDVVNRVRPYLRRLMEATGETVHLVEREGTDVVYIDKEESFSNTIQMVSRIGSRIPLYRTGVGKAILAELEPVEVRRLWEQSSITRMTPYTITDYGEFLRCLEEAGERGYALDNEENESGVRCIAASLPDHAGNVRYAFSISAPVNRMDNDRIRELGIQVLDAKQKMMQEI